MPLPVKRDALLKFHAETQDKSELESARVVGSVWFLCVRVFTVACFLLFPLQLNSQFVTDYLRINGGFVHW